MFTITTMWPESGQEFIAPVFPIRHWPQTLNDAWNPLLELSLRFFVTEALLMGKHHIIIIAVNYCVPNVLGQLGRSVIFSSEQCVICQTIRGFLKQAEIPLDRNIYPSVFCRISSHLPTLLLNPQHAAITISE